MNRVSSPAFCVSWWWFSDGFLMLVGGLEYFVFSHSVGNVIIPTDFHIFQSRYTTNQIAFSTIHSTLTYINQFWTTYELVIFWSTNIPWLHHPLYIHEYPIITMIPLTNHHPLPLRTLIASWSSTICTSARKTQSTCASRGHKPGPRTSFGSCAKRSWRKMVCLTIFSGKIVWKMGSNGISS